MSKPSDAAKSLDELSAALCTDRRNLFAWRHIPGSPRSRSVSEWKGWMAANGHGQDSARSTASVELTQERLRAARLKNDATERAYREGMEAEAQAAAEEALDRIMVRVRVELIAKLPATIAAQVPAATPTDRERLARALIEQALQAARPAPATANI